MVVRSELVMLAVIVVALLAIVTFSENNPIGLATRGAITTNTSTSIGGRVACVSPRAAYQEEAGGFGAREELSEAKREALRTCNENFDVLATQRSKSLTDARKFCDDDYGPEGCTFDYEPWGQSTACHITQCTEYEYTRTCYTSYDAAGNIVSTNCTDEHNDREYFGCIAEGDVAGFISSCTKPEEKKSIEPEPQI